jgi:hypothetical protein
MSEEERQAFREATVKRFREWEKEPETSRKTWVETVNEFWKERGFDVKTD